jgi:16S rRNA processing protein RimM
MLVVVGRIGRPHGIRGAISIEIRTDEPEQRFAPGTVLLCDSGLEVTVETQTWHSGRLLLTFEGYSDRSAVETLRGQVLSVERDLDATPDDPEEFYDTALVGCAVVTEAGEPVGRVTEVSHLPAHDMLVIEDDDGREILVPFAMAMVPTVDIALRCIVIAPPPGLLDPDGPGSGA